jgi:hypothetical protein
MEEKQKSTGVRVADGHDATAGELLNGKGKITE